MTDLKPCPFCNAALVEAVAFRRHTARTFVHPSDKPCIAHGLRVIVGGDTDNVEAWNRRGAHPTTSIPVPYAWAVYLLLRGAGARLGVASNLSQLRPAASTLADAWARREQVRIVGFEPNAVPYVDSNARTLAPELGVDTDYFIDCRAEELSIDGATS